MLPLHHTKVQAQHMCGNNIRFCLEIPEIHLCKIKQNKLVFKSLEFNGEFD